MPNERVLPATCQTIDFESVNKQKKSISSGIEKIGRKLAEMSMEKSSKAEGNLCDLSVLN